MELKLLPVFYMRATKSPTLKVETLERAAECERSCGSPALLPTAKRE
jgi:diaminopimelate epimerase